MLSGSRSSIKHQCYVAVSLCNGLSSSCLAVSQLSWQGWFFAGPWCMVPRHLSCTRRPLLEVVGLPLPAGGSHLPLVRVTSTGRGDDQRWLTLRGDGQAVLPACFCCVRGQLGCFLKSNKYLISQIRTIKLNDILRI